MSFVLQIDVLSWVLGCRMAASRGWGDIVVVVEGKKTLEAWRVKADLGGLG